MATGRVETLREAGLRVTQPRVELLRLLDEAKTPLTHADAVRLLGEKGGDPATTYRNLLRMVDVGIARIASIVGGGTHFERASESKLHPHFHCQDCGTVSCLRDACIALSLGPWEEALSDAELTFVGTCPDCREKAQAAL